MTDRAPAIEILESAAAVARRGAELLAAALAAAVASRGRATIALSGGRTPAPMFAELAAKTITWDRVELFQVDERVAPRGHAERNSIAIEAAFARTAVRRHWMPVERTDLEAAALNYSLQLEAAAGAPPVLDAVHLGLGADGHTASLFPGSAALASQSAVAVTGFEGDRRRLTLTLGVLNRARTIVWIVCGRDKRAMLKALVQRDPPTVASRVRTSSATIIADRDAAAALDV